MVLIPTEPRCCVPRCVGNGRREVTTKIKVAPPLDDDVLAVQFWIGVRNPPLQLFLRVASELSNQMWDVSHHWGWNPNESVHLLLEEGERIREVQSLARTAARSMYARKQ